MSDTTEPFFALPSNNALLRRFLQAIEGWDSKAMEPKDLPKMLAQVLELMLSYPEKFDEYASVNIAWIGRNFLGEIEECLNSPPDRRSASMRSIFTSGFRFLCELEFTEPGEPAMELRRVTTFVHQNLETFEGQDRQQLIYAAYTMPAHVAKQLLSHPSVVEFQRFAETVETSRKAREEWNADMQKREGLLQGLSENLRRVASEYNFVGLVHGFQQLKRAKEQERKFSFGSLLIVALAMLALPLAQLVYVAVHLDVIESHKATLVYSLPTIVTIEVVLLYFFRVVLGQFRSVKAQLLQIDLRISICQFIESYADYVSNLRTKDTTALSKFEALIFSGLVADDSGIPSTFDGAEQIASLIRSLRGRKD